MIKIRRRQYLVNRPVQLRYLSLVTVPVVFLLAALYYLIYYSLLNQILMPEGIVAMLLPAMKKVNFVVFFTLPVVLFLIVRASLVYSNRIVGPIPRIERELDKVIAGDYSVRLKARDNDDLLGFVNKINTLLENVEKAKGGV